MERASRRLRFVREPRHATPRRRPDASRVYIMFLMRSSRSSARTGTGASLETDAGPGKLQLLGSIRDRRRRLDAQPEERAAVRHHEGAPAVDRRRHGEAVARLDAVDHPPVGRREQEEPVPRRAHQERALDGDRRRHAALRQVAPPHGVPVAGVDAPHPGEPGRAQQQLARGHVGPLAVARRVLGLLPEHQVVHADGLVVDLQTSACRSRRRARTRRPRSRRRRPPCRWSAGRGRASCRRRGSVGRRRRRRSRPRRRGRRWAIAPTRPRASTPARCRPRRRRRSCRAPGPARRSRRPPCRRRGVRC